MGVNVVHVAGGAAVATGASLLRNFIGPKIGVADKGVMGYAMQIATGYLAKMLVGNVLGQRAIANKGFEYTLANVVERAVRENVLPMTGIGRFLGQAYTGATPTPSAGGRVRSRFVNSSRALNTAVRPTVDMTTPIDRFAPRY